MRSRTVLQHVVAEWPPGTLFNIPGPGIFRQICGPFGVYYQTR